MIVPNAPDRQVAPLHLESLTEAYLPSFKDLLGGSEFGGCFCAVWTSHDDTWVARCQDPAQPNYAITASRVQQGDHTGFLVYEGDELVAWTGSGPKPAFPFLAQKLGSRLSASDPETWAIGCIAVRADRRGGGLSGPIVAAVMAAARRQGARAIEAYPTRPWDEARSFRGSERLYRRLGFAEVAAEPDGDTEILLMRQDL